MSNQSVDAAASTSNTRKKLTDEERKAKDREYSRRYRAAHPEKVAASKRKYVKNNKALVAEQHLQWREANREHMREMSRRWRSNNVEKAARAEKRYRKNNKEKVAVARNNARRNRRLADPSYRLRESLRNRLRDSLYGKYKSGSAVRDMDCTGQQACDYLESLFDEHMTWENWGTYWEVDHIYPLAKADLEDRIEFLAVVNWRNLQPLEKGANIRKGDTVTPEAQKLFDDLKTQFLKEDAA